MTVRISILKININADQCIKIDQYFGVVSAQFTFRRYTKGAIPTMALLPFFVLLSSRRASLLC